MASTRSPAIPADWLVPDWPAPAGVQALCTTRAGGISRPPYDSLNLGNHVGDDPAAVRANRFTLQSTLQTHTPGARATFLNQVHGDGVAHLDLTTPDGTEADACVTATPGAVCTIMVADCLPVLLAHRSGMAVAAAHAGWRGLAGVGSATPGHGVIESSMGALVKAVQRLMPGVSPAVVAADTLAWLGPCIGPQAFEVGREVRDAFLPGHSSAYHAFSEGTGDRLLANLPLLARQRLAALGVGDVHGNDGSAPWCTVANAGTYFSHRRDAGPLGSTGRMAACIWRD